MTASALLWTVWSAGALLCLLPVLAGTWHLRAAYAHQLVLLAERLANTATPPLLAMAACRDLSTRVRAVLDGAQARGRAGALPVATAIVAAALFIAAVAPLRAVRQVQAPSDRAQQPPLAFETASVKPNKSGEEERYIRIDPSGGSLMVVNMQLRQLITFAYQIQSFQLEGGPDWIASDRFDILAKPEREVPSTGAFFGGQNPLRMMLRTLLADRFKLVMHKETKELPIFELVRARQDGKLGPQLRPAAIDCATRAAAASAETPPPSSGPPGPGSCFMNLNPVSVGAAG
ncbi:MAG TPA: TIGR03435 family protein [Vicinamibacterales bacterium]